MYFHLLPPPSYPRSSWSSSPYSLVVKTWLREMRLGAHVSKQGDLRCDSLGFHYILEMLAQAASNPEIGHWPLRLGEISRPLPFPASRSPYATVKLRQPASVCFTFLRTIYVRSSYAGEHCKVVNPSSCCPSLAD